MYRIIYRNYGTIGVIAVIIFSSACFNYSVKILFSKDFPWPIDLIAGLVLGWITLPMAFICLLINTCRSLGF